MIFFDLNTNDDEALLRHAEEFITHFSEDIDDQLSSSHCLETWRQIEG